MRSARGARGGPDRRTLLRAASALPVLAWLPRGRQERRERRPNVLFFLADQLRSFSVGCYGNPLVRTPRIDELAARGTRFSRAYSASPTCSPYRVQMLTGKYTHVTGFKLEPGWPTLYTHLADAGYFVGHIGKWHMTPDRLQTESGYVPPEVRRGIAYSAMAEVTHRYKHATWFEMDDERPRPAGPWEPDNQAKLAEAFLDARGGDGRKEAAGPFFLTVSVGPPHPPYEPIERFDVYDPADVALRPNVPGGSEEADRGRAARYYGLVGSVDEVLGRLVTRLERNGLADDTIVVFTSDHGDMLGSQGMMAKRKPWEEAVRVPFVVAGPRGAGREGRFAAGAVREDLLSSVDVMPTLLDLCGVDVPAGVQGRRLFRDPGPEALYLEIIVAAGTPDLSPWRAVVTADGWKFATSPARPDWLLHRLGEDPFERENLVAEGRYAERKEDLRGLARELGRKTGDSFFA